MALNKPPYVWTQEVTSLGPLKNASDFPRLKVVLLLLPIFTSKYQGIPRLGDISLVAGDLI